MNPMRVCENKRYLMLAFKEVLMLVYHGSIDIRWVWVSIWLYLDITWFVNVPYWIVAYIVIVSYFTYYFDVAAFEYWWWVIA